MAISVVSYNILANGYIKPEWYPNVAPDILNWDRRKERLLDHIKRLDADILCLQEVEEDAFPYFQEHLTGYEGWYAKKGRGKKDGCATFYRNLKEEGRKTLYYNDQHKGRPSGHLAQITLFENLAIANTHIKWDPPEIAPEERVGLRQIHQLIAFTRLHKKSWLLMGDFNAQPTSLRIKALLNAGFDFAGHRGFQPTCNVNQKPQQLDYVFYSPDLEADLLLDSTIESSTLMPSLEEPSDHLAVKAEISHRAGPA